MDWLKKLFSNNKANHFPTPQDASRSSKKAWDKEFEKLPIMGKTATSEDKQWNEISRMEEENARILESDNTEREKERQKIWDELIVIDGAELECPLCTNPKGILKVNLDTPTTQEKKTATIEEKSSLSLVFRGNCKKSPNRSFPCQVSMITGNWKNTGSMKVQDRPPLLLKSTIPCHYGGVDIKIIDSGQINKPELNMEGAPIPIPKKKIKIKALQDQYTVVLKKDGTLFGPRFPNLEFEITDGAPGEPIDIQVAKVDPSLLTNTVGISDSWDKNKLPVERISVKTFSSYSHDEIPLTLDASGKAFYTMPLEWWRDLARQPLHEFSTMKIYFKVLSFSHPSKVNEESIVHFVEVSNNLIELRTIQNVYTENALGLPVKDFSAEFVVKEAGTTEMYTWVQRKKGGMGIWDVNKRMTRPIIEEHDQKQICHYPEWTLDRINLNPRYADGVYPISNGGKTATIKKQSSSQSVNSKFPWAYTHIDFDTRIHLNYDVPDAINVIRLPDNTIKGAIPTPEPLPLANIFWNARILQSWNSAQAKTLVSHPAVFIGP